MRLAPVLLLALAGCGGSDPTASVRLTESPLTTPEATATRPRATVAPTTVAPTTVAPTTRAPSPAPTRRRDVAYVLVRNNASEAAKVYVNRESRVVAAHTTLRVEVVPSPDRNDYVSVASVRNPGCGRSDPGLYFEVGKTYRVAIEDGPGCQDSAGRPVTYPTFEVYPA